MKWTPTDPYKLQVPRYVTDCIQEPAIPRHLHGIRVSLLEEESVVLYTTSLAHTEEILPAASHVALAARIYFRHSENQCTVWVNLTRKPDLPQACLHLSLSQRQSAWHIKRRSLSLRCRQHCSRESTRQPSLLLLCVESNLEPSRRRFRLGSTTCRSSIDLVLRAGSQICRRSSPRWMAEKPEGSAFPSLGSIADRAGSLGRQDWTPAPCPRCFDWFIFILCFL